MGRSGDSPVRLHHAMPELLYKAVEVQVVIRTDLHGARGVVARRRRSLLEGTPSVTRAGSEQLRDPDGPCARVMVVVEGGVNRKSGAGEREARDFSARWVPAGWAGTLPSPSARPGFFPGRRSRRAPRAQRPVKWPYLQDFPPKSRQSPRGGPESPSRAAARSGPLTGRVSALLPPLSP